MRIYSFNTYNIGGGIMNCSYMVCFSTSIFSHLPLMVQFLQSFKMGASWSRNHLGFHFPGREFRGFDRTRETFKKYRRKKHDKKPFPANFHFCCRFSWNLEILKFKIHGGLTGQGRYDDTSLIYFLSRRFWFQFSLVKFPMSNWPPKI